jgi:DNA-binding transcriptional LysR family regulator
MEMSQIRYVLAAAKALNFTQAATDPTSRNPL